jgi:hypothetical protein
MVELSDFGFARHCTQARERRCYYVLQQDARLNNRISGCLPTLRLIGATYGFLWMLCCMGLQ